ncbi:GNAT family N-acetyltransferase [Streptomyces decoyicus]|uniref:GNAT family N-acetyltransferase n=1 Tax=Streptomyces decoyicus TaxID=249567 RepID=UPI000B02BC6B
MNVVPALPTKQVFRPITGSDEVELFNQIPYVFNHEVAGYLVSGRRRRDRTWIALDDEGKLLARVAWWCRPRDTSPFLLDVFDYLPGTSRPVPRCSGPPWPRSFPRAPRLPSTPGSCHPTGATTGGAHRCRRSTGRRGAARRPTVDDEFVHYTSPRDWWRVATIPDSGEPVGLVIAARNQYRPIIAYIGVLAEHRGQRYIDEILAEGTRVLATTEPERIRASTDVGNTPMAAAFARAGYTVFEREIVMTWG